MKSLYNTMCGTLVIYGTKGYIRISQLYAVAQQRQGKNHMFKSLNTPMPPPPPPPPPLLETCSMSVANFVYVI